MIESILSRRNDLLSVKHRASTTFPKFNKSVTKKNVENGEYLVDLDVHVENQDGLMMVPGSATVQLPSKNDFMMKIQTQVTCKDLDTKLII